jgi:2,3-diketo-5-methylthio-1-phosphopentane phosphatase
LEKTFKIFVDFDGTITKLDVGANIFLHFGNYEKVIEIEKKISNMEIDGADGWKQLFQALPSIKENELVDYVRTFEIDQSFKEFLAFAQGNSLKVFIISDGFDYYIKRILERENIIDVEFFSNILEIGQDGSLMPKFPYGDEECIKCSNCKRNHVLENSNEDEFTVYIGNGSSDVCPVKFCDFIFAKDTLLKYCEKERITYFPFNNFIDIKFKLMELMQKKRLKKRHQAAINRKHVYQLG